MRRDRPCRRGRIGVVDVLQAAQPAIFGEQDDVTLGLTRHRSNSQLRLYRTVWHRRQPTNLQYREIDTRAPAVTAPDNHGIVSLVPEFGSTRELSPQQAVKHRALPGCECPRRLTRHTNIVRGAVPQYILKPHTARQLGLHAAVSRPPGPGKTFLETDGVL